MNTEEGWIQLKFVLPYTEADELFRVARDILEFKQIDTDWCTEKRFRDNATFDYVPCPPPPDRKEHW